MATIEELNLENYFPDLDIDSDFITIRRATSSHNYLVVTRVKKEIAEERKYLQNNLDLTFNAAKIISLGTSNKMDVAFIGRFRCAPCSFVFLSIDALTDLNELVCCSNTKRRLIMYYLKNRLTTPTDGESVLKKDLSSGASHTALMLKAIVDLGSDKSILALHELDQENLLLHKGRAGTFIFESDRHEYKDRVVTY